jgi:tRNA A-37 threonylcarbamoyl transferase component Bud32
MAEVFAGRAIGSHGFQKPVAIKRLLPELASDEVFVSRLIAEAKLVVGMQHGNLVSVIDLAREDDDVFLVMEYVDGPSLRELLRARPRPLSLGVAMYVAMSAGTGLGYAHGRGIIHADISPSNLLLTTSGEVLVADFGIARREGYGHGMVEGKWAYMSPEQSRGEALTPASDVFSLGVVLYELITGKHPFVPPKAAVDPHAPRRFAPVRQLRADIPAELEAVVARCLAHDPLARYARMQDVIDALAEVRFRNGLRDGAAELAATIRAVGEIRARTSMQNLVTTGPHPVIETASLLRAADGTPARGVTFEPVENAARAPTAPLPTRPSLAEFHAVIAGEQAVPPPPLAIKARTRKLAALAVALVVAITALAALAARMEPEARHYSSNTQK